MRICQNFDAMCTTVTHIFQTVFQIHRYTVLAGITENRKYSDFIIETMQ